MTNQNSNISPAPSATGTSAWLARLLPFFLTVVAILVLYRQTALSMAYQWWNYETYAHGMVVPLMSGWLIWRQRAHLVDLAIRPLWWSLIPLALACFFWLLGDLAIVLPVSQFALVAMLVLAVPATLGLAVARAIAFPLCFLFFAVPVGEFLLPTLMGWTADFTVSALRFSGIPVYREGQQFVIPSGNWSVVEACSGIRYLIASTMVGALYAYLTYHSLRRRLLFFVVSIIVPLVANWLRAYMIVMIGHYSDNRLATGVDHLIYGWIFFGVVMMLMFWIGSRWREDDQPLPLSKPVAGGNGAASRQTWLAAALVALVASFGQIGSALIVDHDKTLGRPSLNLPTQLGAWQTADTALTDWRPRYLDPSITTVRSFTKGSEAVSLYIGYYRGQNSERKLISSSNTLVMSNDSVWARVATSHPQADVAGQSLEVLSTELLRSTGSRLVIWTWYWVDGKFTASEYWAKAYTAWSRFMGRGDDSAVVMVYALKRDAGYVGSDLKDFVKDAGPELSDVLTKASLTR